MKAESNGHEHEFEPEFGLPEPLPHGETILWQGAPDFSDLAVRVFHLRKAIGYFAIIIALRAVYQSMQGLDTSSTVVAMIWPVSLALISVTAIATLAWLTARTTAYTLTDQRVVMRIGIVLTLTFNLPLKTIEMAGLKQTGKGFGDIPLSMRGNDRIAWLHLWPHARPWRLAKPEPMLRCLPEAALVAAKLTNAWAAAHSPNGKSNHQAIPVTGPGQRSTNTMAAA